MGRLDWGPAGTRWRTFLRTQTPFAGGVTALVLLVALSEPASVGEGEFLCAIGLSLIATVVALAVPGERDRNTWIVVVPLVDIVAVALFRDVLYDTIPAAGVLVVFPVMWLSSGFGPWAVVVASAGAFLVTIFPFLRSGRAPEDATAWVNALILPVMVSLISITVFDASMRLRRQQAELAHTSRELGRLLEASTDMATITRSVADAVDAGILYLDVEGRPQLRNAAADEMAELFQFDFETLSSPIVYGPDRVTPVPPEEQFVPRALRGESLSGLVYWVGPPGDQTAVAASCREVRREGGDVLGTVIVVYDVTDLANAIRLREDFLAGVSHELRTPLTSIVGYIDLIQDARDTEALGIASELEVIQRNVDHLLRIIGDLLAASSGEVPLSIERTDIALLLEQRVAGILPLADQAGVVLHLRNEAAVEADVDPVRMSQVIDNILSNAVKYTPSGGRVAVELERDGADFLVRVSDTGVGISPSDLRQVFDRFFRAGAVREEAIQGTGLGLSIVKLIVDAHGGTIDLRSVLREGTDFVVRLPMRRHSGSSASINAG